MPRPRPYQQRRRADSRAARQRTIVDSAVQLLRDTGFRRFGLDEVAERAGVGRTTLFQHFGSKLGLLRAVEAKVSARAGVDQLLLELAHPDPLVALEAAFRRGAAVWAAERDTFRTLFGLAVVDPEMREVMAAKEAGRRGLCESLARRLHRRRRLRPGVSPRRAAALLRLLTSFDSFDALYGDRGDPGAVADDLLLLVTAFIDLT